MIISVSLAITFLATSVFLAVVSSKWKTIAKRVPELETELCFLSMHYAEKQTGLEYLQEMVHERDNTIEQMSNDLDDMLKQFDESNKEIKMLREYYAKGKTIGKMDEIFGQDTGEVSDIPLPRNGGCAPRNYD